MFIRIYVLWCTIYSRVSLLCLCYCCCRSDERVGRIVRSLSSIRAREVRHEQEKRHVVLSTVHSRFPWLERNNALPNYFLRSRKRSPEASDAVRRSTVVFLRQPTAARNVLNSCLERFANGSRQYEAGKTSDANDRLGTALSAKHFQNKLSSFDLCPNKGMPCSYISTFYDPFLSSVSLYKYCRTMAAGADDNTMCATMDATRVTLRQWLLHHGSTTFQHLVSNPSLCSHRTKPNGAASVDASCWHLQKRELERLSPGDRGYLLDYVIDNLEKWFFFIALEDDMEISAKLFEKAFKRRISGCAFTKDTETTTGMDNRTHQKRHNGNSVRDEVENDVDKDMEDSENDPEYLIDDYSVVMALGADQKIYRRAKEIFRIQKQCVFNTI